MLLKVYLRWLVCDGIIRAMTTVTWQGLLLSVVESISCESSCDVAQGWCEGRFVQTEASSSKIPRARASNLFALTHTSIVVAVAPQS